MKLRKRSNCRLSICEYNRNMYWYILYAKWVKFTYIWKISCLLKISLTVFSFLLSALFGD